LISSIGQRSPNGNGQYVAIQFFQGYVNRAGKLSFRRDQRGCAHSYLKRSSAHYTCPFKTGQLRRSNLNSFFFFKSRYLRTLPRLPSRPCRPCRPYLQAELHPVVLRAFWICLTRLCHRFLVSLKLPRLLILLSVF
jgi:hypothetical protein